MRDFLDGMQKWPLLLGAILCFTLVVYEETVTDQTEIAIAVTGTVIGSTLLGAWLVLYIIDFERRWQQRHEPRGTEPSDRSSTLDE